MAPLLIFNRELQATTSGPLYMRRRRSLPIGLAARLTTTNADCTVAVDPVLCLSTGSFVGLVTHWSRNSRSRRDN